MHTEAKQTPSSPLLRLGGTLTGAFVSALCGAILFFIAAILDVVGGMSFSTFLSGITFVGACTGFAIPRQTVQSLPFFFPEIFGSH